MHSISLMLLAPFLEPPFPARLSRSPFCSFNSIIASFSPTVTQEPKSGSSRNISEGPTKAADIARTIDDFPEPFSPSKTCQPAGFWKVILSFFIDRMLVISSSLMYITPTTFTTKIKRGCIKTTLVLCSLFYRPGKTPSTKPASGQNPLSSRLPDAGTSRPARRQPHGGRRIATGTSCGAPR